VEVFTFYWDVLKEGFRWVEANELPPKDLQQPIQPQRTRWLTDLVPIGGSYLKWRYKPLEKFPALFRTFADVPATEEGILAFANEYGSLGIGHGIILDVHGPDNELLIGGGEPLKTWVEQVHAMQRAIAVWDAFEAGDLSKLREVIRVDKQEQHIRAIYLDKRERDVSGAVIFDSEHYDRGLSPFISPTDVFRPALFYVQQIINERLQPHTSTRLLYTPEQDRLRIHVVPTNLLGCLWLQFARAIDGNKHYRRCRECGRWFEISLDAYRTSKEFCSNACRSKAYRGRKKARGGAELVKENGR
jgi:hypothetical protein